MQLILDPPRGVGPIEIGMSFDVAQRELQAIEGFVSPGQGQPPGFANYESEMSIAVEPGRDGLVKSIEIYRPVQDVDVYYSGISIFGDPADEVIDRLSSSVHLVVEDGGLRAIAPNLLLALWRDTLPEDEEDEDGRYFESVLVAAPGYYE